MNFKDDVARLDEEIDALENELIQGKARLAGLVAQRASLSKDLAAYSDQQQRVAAPTVTELNGIPRTDAIVEVLRAAGTPMSIRQVWDGLKAGGRDEQGYQVIASTLNLLLQSSRVTRPSRGRYAA